MKVTTTAIPDVLLIEPVVHGDQRGFFLETWHEARMRAAGIRAAFVQDNQSRSVGGTAAGAPLPGWCAAGKAGPGALGAIFDVAVDLRRSSPTFGRWIGAVLSATRTTISSGCRPASPTASTSPSAQADVVYKCTDYYAAEHDRALRWDDPALGHRLAAVAPGAAAPVPQGRRGPALGEARPIRERARRRARPLITGAGGQVGLELCRSWRRPAGGSWPAALERWTSPQPERCARSSSVSGRRS